ncbi:MAG: hypothetical protein ACE5GE_01795 [Phycisphaerae bacterium]
MRLGSIVRAWGCLGLIVTGCALGGCGVLAAERSSFSNQAATSEGLQIFVEDIEEIVDDTQLTADEQRQALRDLGIEDEDLIEVLLTLP